MKQLPNINSLRFFLALLVVLFHLPQFCINRGFPFFDELSIFHKGTEAVYVFFSLSGFLIIRQLYHEKLTTDNINLKQFYTNRALRIFPLYYLILIFGFLYYELILPNLGFPSDRQYNLLEGIILGATFFANILATYKPGGMLEILWSLSIEEQFYIVIAPLMALISTKRISILLIVFTIIYFFIYNGFDIQFLKKYNMLYYYFSLSGIIAILSVKFPKIRFPNVVRILILGLFVAFFTTSLFSNLKDFYYHLFAMILFPLSIWILATKPIILLSNRFMNYLGKISYGIYMYHSVTFQILGFVFLKVIDYKIINSISFIFIFYLGSISLTIIISHFSYQYFERLFLNMKKNYRQTVVKKFIR